MLNHLKRKGSLMMREEIEDAKIGDTVEVDGKTYDVMFASMDSVTGRIITPVTEIPRVATELARAYGRALVLDIVNSNDDISMDDLTHMESARDLPDYESVGVTTLDVIMYAIISARHGFESDDISLVPEVKELINSELFLKAADALDARIKDGSQRVRKFTKEFATSAADINSVDQKATKEGLNGENHDDSRGSDWSL